jgi:hypothetical protein
LINPSHFIQMIVEEVPEARVDSNGIYL